MSLSIKTNILKYFVSYQANNVLPVCSVQWPTQNWFYGLSASDSVHFFSKHLILAQRCKVQKSIVENALITQN